MGKKDKSASSDSKRAYAFSFVLYPDNPAQIQLLKYLRDDRCPYACRIIYIEHLPEDDDKKTHLHVLAKFDQQKTVAGVRKMFGIQADVWRLYELQEADVVDDLKMKHGSPERVRNIVYKKFPVLSDPENPLSFIQYDYDKSNLYNARLVTERYPCEDDQAYIRTKVYTVPHVEACSDCNAYALYMLHWDFNSHISGKIMYDMEDLKGDSEFKKSCFPNQKNMDSVSSLSKLYEITRTLVTCHDSKRQVLKDLIESNDKDTIEFLMSHHRFVDDWMLNTFKKDSNNF